MRVQRDPEGSEAFNLLHACQITGKDILEIGCGEGWLTWQYAKTAGRVIGVDPGISDLQKAKTSQKVKGINIQLVACMGEGLPFPADFFDIAVYSNTL